MNGFGVECIRHGSQPESVLLGCHCLARSHGRPHRPPEYLIELGYFELKKQKIFLRKSRDPGPRPGPWVPAAPEVGRKEKQRLSDSKSKSLSLALRFEGPAHVQRRERPDSSTQSCLVPW